MTQVFRLFLLALFFPLLAFAQDAGPEALVKKITEDVMAAIKSDKALAAGDRQKAVKLAEEKILPYVDFEEATRLAVGRVPLDHQRAARVHAHRREVDAAGAQGAMDLGGVGGQVRQQVQHLVAEGHVEARPRRGHGARRFEVERPAGGRASDGR